MGEQEKQNRYYHAHKVLKDKCCGRMACMRPCPAKAIRVRNGKARISERLCIDCGVCIRTCPSEAIVPISDPVGEISRFKYKVVVPSPVLYSQFDSSIHPYVIHLALKKIGFDEVIDLSLNSVSVDRALTKYLKTYRERLPLISSYCPAIVRLLQVKYPDLVQQLVPFDVPREITAREIRRRLPAELGLKPDDIGIVYVAPCPAIIVSIKQPAEKEKSWFTGVFSMRDVYAAIFPHILTIEKTFSESDIPEDFTFRVGWSALGAAARIGDKENWFFVAGMDHARQIFDDIENSRLRNIEFVEALSCMLGCNNGPFNVENPYVARTNSIRRRDKFLKPLPIDDRLIEERLGKRYYFLEHPVRPRPTQCFDTDLPTSIKRMKGRERVYRKLPKIDCGCCGSPTCLAFAEDVVCGEAKLTDCIYLSGRGSKD